MKFRTTIKQGDKTATGIEIPDDVIAALGAGRKPPVKLTVNGYSYRSTVATVDGNSMVGFSAEANVHPKILQTLARHSTPILPRGRPSIAFRTATRAITCRW